MVSTAQGKRGAALASVGSGVLLTVIKLVVGFATASLGILSEAAHSALDLVAAGVTFLVVHIAEQPPDENHPYGHARAENLGALAQRADAIAAACVALIALYVSWGLGRRATRALMDDVPHDLNSRLVPQIEKLPSVLGNSVRVRSRFVGEQPYVDISLKVPRGRSLEEAHLISEAAREAVRKELPEADVVVNVDPARQETEGYTSAIYAAANRLGWSVHNLDIFQLQDGLKVALDLELPSHLTLGQAHEYSEQLTAAIRQELPLSSQISIHLEPRRDSLQPAVHFEPLAREIEAAVRSLPEAQVVTRVDTFLSDGGAVVTLSCSYPAAMPLVDVHHSMAGIERALRHLVPAIVRVQLDPELAEASSDQRGAPVPKSRKYGMPETKY